jgi:hypothetical protein
LFTVLAAIFVAHLGFAIRRAGAVQAAIRLPLVGGADVPSVATCLLGTRWGTNGGRGDEVTEEVNGIWLQLKTSRMLLVYVSLFYDLCACTDRYAVVLRMQNEQAGDVMSCKPTQLCLPS